jgi:hypothetical protein
MTQFQPKPLFRHLSACLIICTMIAAGSAAAKDSDAQPDKSSEAAATASDTPKTRQIAVEPGTAAETETPAETNPSEEVAKSPDPEPKTSAPEKQVAAEGEEEESDSASAAPEAKRPARPDTGLVHVYVHRHPAAYGYGGYRPSYQGSIGYRPAYGHGDYGYRSTGYHHCD